MLLGHPHFRTSLSRSMMLLSERDGAEKDFWSFVVLLSILHTFEINLTSFLHSTCETTQYVLTPWTQRLAAAENVCVSVCVSVCV